MTQPVVFVSYSHDSPQHKQWVSALATKLIGSGVVTILDQWDLPLGADVVSFMEASIARADRVLLVCTEEYVRKADERTGGVGYESTVITGELVSKIDTKKFIPLVRQATRPIRLPHYLGNRRFLDYGTDAEYDERTLELLAELHGQPLVPKPALGVSPFGSVPQTPNSPARLAATSGITPDGRDIVSDPWFATHAAHANTGLRGAKLEGAMEVLAALHDPVNKSQLDLLNAARNAQVKTFGWPIGLVADGHEVYKPRPLADGIVAEISVAEKLLSERPTYDYWAARVNGDYYLLQSLFEDERAENALFFDTRIVRVTEAFMFLAGYYEGLGVAPSSLVTVRIGHRGLKGRTLTSAGRRHVFPRETAADASVTALHTTVAALRSDIAENVKRIVEPMFMLFDFAKFELAIYDDIVNKFVAGQVV